ncbi:diguanylate cyclase [Iamia majanohamensis]|uniref:Diguanylate cyclase n=1 Tax=Iamia majanohamensis TaxID=467976 RepID=A0AAE9Y6E0_9ACTN|nr:diguanylate cyclase [Iamia majanohamensis]WCO67392.1 diguanylate cyclase [Iamia majanohamensis]
MTHRAAPGVVAGCAGLVLAVGAMATDQAWMVAAAGVAALVAGLFTLGLADRLRRSQAEAAEATSVAERARAESDAMAARAAQFEAEARRREPAPVGPAAPSVDHTKVTDEETGLFNAAFFAVTLDKRVSAARRGLRPLTLALLEPITGLGGDDPAPRVDRDVAAVLVDTLRDSDIACRLEHDMVALILEDTPENGAVWTVERVRRRLAEQGDGISLRAGVACYPAHAFDAEQLLGSAQAALASARDWHQDRIEVALVPED